MAKAKDIRIDNMVSVSAVTDNQKKAFVDYKLKKNLFLYGAWYKVKPVSFVYSLKKFLEA